MVNRLLMNRYSNSLNGKLTGTVMVNGLWWTDSNSNSLDGKWTNTIGKLVINEKKIH
jgi:hypothetical protein